MRKVHSNIINKTNQTKHKYRHNIWFKLQMVASDISKHFNECFIHCGHKLIKMHLKQRCSRHVFFSGNKKPQSDPEYLMASRLHENCWRSSDCKTTYWSDRNRRQNRWIPISKVVNLEHPITCGSKRISLHYKVYRVAFCYVVKLSKLQERSEHSESPLWESADLLWNFCLINKWSGTSQISSQIEVVATRTFL